METENKPKEETKEEEYKLVEVPTQYGIAIQAPNKEILDTNTALVSLLNKVTKIEKALV